VNVWTDSFVSGHGTVARSCEPHNKTSFTIKGGKFLEYEHLNEDFALYSLLLRSRAQSPVEWWFDSRQKHEFSLLQTVQSRWLLGPIHPPIQLGIGSLALGIKRSRVTLTTCRCTDLYFSPNFVRVIKSRMRWARNVARMGERRGVYRVSVGKTEG